MSDPVANVEVEDVLSSIRRLVSEDSSSSMKTTTPVTLSADRLVLTPALRVEDHQDEDVAAVEPTIQAWSEFGAGPEDQDAMLVYRSENDTDPTSDVYEPEYAEDVQDHYERPQEETHEVPEAPAAEPFVPEAVVNHAEPEAPSMKSDDVGSDSDAHNAEGDNAENDEVDVEPQQAAFSQPADKLLDENALRDIMRETVREELQGALGEHITRNVRKLVRREIYRALAAQELE
jgi:hypothetical protein